MAPPLFGVHALAVEPSESLPREYRANGFEVVEDIVENVHGRDNHANFVACFEVLNHVYNPRAFVCVLTRLVRPGGYVVVSTLGVVGFDIQVLWDRSNAVFLPHHISFLSVAGFACLFTRSDLVELEVTTLGQLDVDIVRNALQGAPDLLKGSRLLRRLLADKVRAAAFQPFLSENLLSSHSWVVDGKAAAAT